MINIGEALKEQRENAKYSQEQLAKNTGITQAALSYWEKNQRTPNIIACIKLADFYGITLDELVGRDAFKPNFHIDQRDNKGTINNNF